MLPIWRTAQMLRPPRKSVDARIEWCMPKTVATPATWQRSVHLTVLIDIVNGPRHISDRLCVHIVRCRFLVFRFSAFAEPLRQLRHGVKRSVRAAAPIVLERWAAPRGVSGLGRRIAYMQRRLRAAF